MMTAAKMPVILYEGYQYDPADPENGLFRSSFLVCVSGSQCLGRTRSLDVIRSS